LLKVRFNYTSYRIIENKKPAIVRRWNRCGIQSDSLVVIYEKVWGLCHNFFFTWAIVFSIKTIPHPNILCDRYLPEHSIADSSQNSNSLLKQLYSGADYDPVPGRRFTGPSNWPLYTFEKRCSVGTALSQPGGSFASLAVCRWSTRNKETNAISG